MKKGLAKRDGFPRGEADVNSLDGGAPRIRMGCGRVAREQRNRSRRNKRSGKHRHGKPGRLKRKETRKKTEISAGV